MLTVPIRPAVAALSLVLVLCGHLEAAGDEWAIQVWQDRRPTGQWVASDLKPTAGPDGEIIFERRMGKRACLCRTFDVDLARAPVLEVVTGNGHAHWRLTGRVDGGDELLLADYQTEGTCRRNVAARLFVKGKQRVTVRFIMWGWGGPEVQRLVLKSVKFGPEGPECDANAMSGLMLERHQKVLARAASIRPTKREHPSLRYRNSQKPELIQKARTTHQIFAKAQLSLVDHLADEKAKPAIVLGPELRSGDAHKWRGLWLQLRPPQVPHLRPGEGWDPFEGISVTATWRTLSWHTFSQWVIGAALTDDPAFAEQAKRWVLAMARWRFWLRPTYIYFDFTTGYGLQNFAMGYDMAYPLMTEAERAEVRDAMAQLARGLYLNTLTGHGTIYNDLRGNHTAVTLCGLGLAGLALLEEHPDAARWAALAEQFMLDAFEEHTSGAWTESPSYGNYGVDEWLKLAEMLRNVAGRDHLKHPFLKRYGDFSLMISDWEGRNLGYNGGCCGERWNHWIFFYIANERRWPEVQWLADFATQGVEGFGGYGDAFWWADPTLEARRPTATNVGKHFGDVGLSVWRSGWEDDCTILLHHCGIKGQHKEQNMNHFTLYVRGQRMLPDGLGGRTTDHNVPLATNRGQNKWGPGRTLRFHTDERSGYSLGDGTNAYRRKGLRHMLYLRSGVLAIVDDITLSTRRDETVAFLLHPNGDTRVEDDGFVTTSGGVSLVAAFADDAGNALRPSVSPRRARRRAEKAHDVKAERKGRGLTRTITLLRFGKATDLPAKRIDVRRSGDGVDFCLGQETLRVGLKPGAMSDGVTTNAALWLARLVGGRCVEGLAVGEEGEAVSIEHARGPATATGCVSFGLQSE